MAAAYVHNYQPGNDLSTYRYRDGMLLAKEEVNSSEVQLAAEEMMTLVEQRQVDQMLEHDIDDLLGWTNTLNFDE